MSKSVGFCRPLFLGAYQNFQCPSVKASGSRIWSQCGPGIATLHAVWKNVAVFPSIRLAMGPSLGSWAFVPRCSALRMMRVACSVTGALPDLAVTVWVFPPLSVLLNGWMVKR